MRGSTATRSRRKIAAATLAAVVVVWILGAPVLADLLMVERPIEKADAIVILSGAADYAQRARGGAAVFKQGIAPKIILTDDDQRGGWDDNEKDNPYFVERMIREVTKCGVPAEAIEGLPQKVYGTDEEADLIVKTAAERGYRSVLVVTSDFHSRRALWTFDRAAGRARANLTVGLVRSPAGDRYPNRYTWWLTPHGWRIVAGEYVKFAYYWLFY